MSAADAAAKLAAAREAASETKRGKFTGRLASSVTMRQIDWLWQPWIPRGALTLLYGEEGIGKGSTAAYIVAQATRGGLDGTPMNVEWVTFEDDPDTVVAPRLAAAGADLDRVRFHDEGSGNYESPLVLPDDIGALGEAMTAWSSKLLVIDPLPDSLREGLKDNNNADVRAALRPLQQMAKQLSVAVVGVAHPNKGATTAANKVMGSKAFRTVPRSVILFAGDPDDPQGPTRIMCLSKSNGSATKPSVKLRIDAVEVPGAGSQPCVAIEGESEYCDADLVTFAATGKMARGGGVAVSQGERARLLILELLTAGGGEIRAGDAYAAGALEDISERTMKRERAALNIEAHGRVWRIPDGWTAPKEPGI